MTQPLEIAKQMVEALESIGKVAFEVAQSDTGSKPAYIKAGWVIETCTKALALAPALLKYLEGMQAERDNLEKRLSALESHASMSMPIGPIQYNDEEQRKRQREIMERIVKGIPNPPKAGE